MTTMIFHVIGHGLDPCENDDDIFCIYFKCYFVISFAGVSSKPSPIYGGSGLIVSGGVGCGIVLNFGGSFFFFKSRYAFFF